MKQTVNQSTSMVQLNVLSGRYQEHYVEAGHFPVFIGRGSECHLQLEELGVWERHVELDFRRDEGFVLRPISNATTIVNGERLEGECLLRNGDLLELGFIKLQFWLGAVKQRSLVVAEGLVWLGLALGAALQAWLLWQLAS